MHIRPLIHEVCTFFDGVLKVYSDCITGKEKIISYFGLFGMYFVSLVVGAAGLLGSICSHYAYGWATLQTAVAVAFCLIAMVLFVNLMKKSGGRVEVLFLLVAPIVLVAFSLFMMPFAVPDEFTHINRVFDNRSGIDFLQIPAQLPAVYSWIPNYSALQDGLATVFDYTALRDTDYSASAYSEINYLVPSIIVSIGRFFDINGYVLIYAARLANAALYVGAGYWMLRRLPAGKIFALVFLLNPMLVQQEASCSPDALCNIAVLCFVVQVVAMRLDGRTWLPAGDWFVLLGFFLLVCLCKYAYIPLALAAVVLYPKIKRQWIRVALPFASVAFAFAAFFLVMLIGYGALFVNMIDHLDPASYWSKLVETLIARSGIIVWQFAGGNLGWPLDDPIADAMVFVPGLWVGYLLMLLVAFLGSFDGRMNLMRRERVFFVVLSIAECLLVYTALWSDNPEIVGPVTGVQGRYLFGPVFLSAFALLPSRKKPFGSWPARWFALAILVLDLLFIAFVVSWFW